MKCLAKMTSEQASSVSEMICRLLMYVMHTSFYIQDTGVRSSLVCYALRLGPGEEVVSRLHQFVAAHNLRAAFIMTCVGSVQRAVLRLANATTTMKNAVRNIQFSYNCGDGFLAPVIR